MPPSPRAIRILRRDANKQKAQISKLEASNKWVKAAEFWMKKLKAEISEKDAKISQLESSNIWLKAAKYKIERGFMKHSIAMNMPHLSDADILAMSSEEREAAFYELEWVKKAIVRLEVKRSQNILSLQGHSGYLYALQSDK